MNLSYLTSSRDDSIVILEDKKATLISLLAKLDCESSDLRELICSVRSSIRETRRQILLEKESREGEEECATSNLSNSEHSEEYRGLKLTQQYLEDSITEFKVKLANAKSELTDSNDRHSYLHTVLVEKDAEIATLTKTAEELNSQKHGMIAQYSQIHTNSKRPFKRRHESGAFFFARDNIRPYPTSSFQFTLSTEPDMCDHLNSSVLDGRSNQSFFTEGDLID